MTVFVVGSNMLSFSLRNHPSLLERRNLLLSQIRKAIISTCAAPALDNEPPPLLPSLSGHKALCQSLLDILISRGLLPNAQRLTRQLIFNSASFSDAISAADYAASRGLPLDLASYAALIKKFVIFGQPLRAEALYLDKVIAGGIDPTLCMLNSMVLCFCRLGKTEAAVAHFDRIIALDSVPCRAACNAIVEELCARGMRLEAFDYFKGIASSFGIRMAPGCCNLLINELCSKKLFDEAFQVFDIMREMGLRSTLHQYKSVFYGLCQIGRVIDAELLSGEMESVGFFIDRTMYTCLIHNYSRARMLKMATRVFLKMLKMGCEPDVYTYNTLIGGFWKLGLYDKGRALYNQMEKSNVAPNAVTYHTMISLYCMLGEVDSALALSKNMADSGIASCVQSYTVLIAALHKDKRSGEAVDLLQNMSDNGILPDNILFFTIMRMYPKEKAVQVALSMLQTIAIKGCKSDPSLGLDNLEFLLEEIARKDLELASVAFGICISAHCMTGEMEKVEFFWEKMIATGAQPLLFTYNSLLKCLCQNALFQEAESLVCLMQDNGVLPDLETYLILISGLCKQGNLGSAFGVLDQMSERGLKLNVAIYDALIGSLGRNRMVYKAEDLFKSMLKDGVDPDETVFMTMINAYVRKRRLQEAHELFNLMMEYSIRPSSYFYTSLISGLVKKNMTERGCHYLNQMIGEGLEPNNVLYTSFINHFFKVGEFEFALRILDLMGQNQIEFDLITYIVLCSGICRNMTGVMRSWKFVNKTTARAMKMLFNLLRYRSSALNSKCLKIPRYSPTELKAFVLKLLQKVKDNEFMPNLYLYNCIISGFCRADMMEEAYYHLGLMRGEEISPNQVTYTLLIDGHICRGEINEAVRIFNRMNAEGCYPDRITYNTLIKGLCRSERFEEALGLSLALQKKGYFPSKSSYEILLRNLSVSGFKMDAFRVFKEMILLSFMPNYKLQSRLLDKLYKDGMMSQAQIVYDFLKKKGKPVDKKVENCMVEYGYAPDVGGFSAEVE